MQLVGFQSSMRRPRSNLSPPGIYGKAVIRSSPQFRAGPILTNSDRQKDRDVRFLSYLRDQVGNSAAEARGGGGIWCYIAPASYRETEGIDFTQYTVPEKKNITRGASPCWVARLKSRRSHSYCRTP